MDSARRNVDPHLCYLSRYIYDLGKRRFQAKRSETGVHRSARKQRFRGVGNGWFSNFRRKGRLGQPQMQRIKPTDSRTSIRAHLPNSYSDSLCIDGECLRFYRAATGTASNTFYEETCRYLFIRQPFVVHVAFHDTVTYFSGAKIEYG